MTTVLAATDLDRTLVHSARAAGPAVDHEVVCLERRGAILTASLLRSTADALGALQRHATWVPATTRSVTEYHRLDLGRLGLEPRYAVCANGGVLLVDGAPDPVWAAQVARLLTDAAPLPTIASLVAGHLARLPPEAAGPIRDADGVLLVVRVRHSPAWLAELAALCTPHRWRTVVHGDKVYVVPAALTKLTAVEEVRSRIGAGCLLAAGDSSLDVELLKAADAAIQPVDGDLYRQGWRAAHVRETGETGLRGGREIARWLLAQARDS